MNCDYWKAFMRRTEKFSYSLLQGGYFMYFMKRGQKEVTEENFKLFRKRCDKNAIFVDAWHSGTPSIGW